MKKGGYKIIDFKGTALSGTAVEIPGILEKIVDNYDKPILVSGVILNGELQDDAYAAVSDTEDTVILTVYGGAITITEDDEVTFAVAKTPAELAAEIGDLEDLDTTEKGSTVGAINEVVEKTGSVFLIRNYNAEFTINASTYKILKYVDFNIEAIPGYTPIGIVAFGTGSLSVVLKDINITSSGGTATAINLTSSQLETTAVLSILYAKTSFMEV